MQKNSLGQSAKKKKLLRVCGRGGAELAGEQDRCKRAREEGRGRKNNQAFLSGGCDLLAAEGGADDAAA
jgi:hypothetical protein